MNRRFALVISLLVSAVLFAACSSPSHSSPSTSTKPSTSTGFATNKDRDTAFVAKLSGSQYASKYSSATQQDLVQYAQDLCKQLSALPAPGLVEIMNMTNNDAAIKFFANTAVASYCPAYAPMLPNLVG